MIEWRCPGDADIEQIKTNLHVLSLPEQLFGDNFLRLTNHGHGIQLAFTACDALSAWQQEALPPLQVASAQQWTQSRADDIQRHQPLRFDYDW